MFELMAVEELDARAAADELVAARDRILTAEADQFRLAAHWADLHAPEFVDDCVRLLPGEERPVPAGADGCPVLAEFAGAELAALLGRSTTSGEQLIADAVNVRHRHPLLWSGIAEGRIRVGWRPRWRGGARPPGCHSRRRCGWMPRRPPTSRACP